MKSIDSGFEKKGIHESDERLYTSSYAKDNGSYYYLQGKVKFDSAFPTPVYTARDIGKANVPTATIEKKDEQRRVQNETVREEIQSSLGKRPSEEQLKAQRARLEEWRNSPEYQQYIKEVEAENEKREALKKAKQGQGFGKRPEKNEGFEK